MCRSAWNEYFFSAVFFSFFLSVCGLFYFLFFSSVSFCGIFFFCGMCPVKCVKVLCSSTPQRSLARNQLLLFCYLLLPSVDFRQGPDAEVTL